MFQCLFLDQPKVFEDSTFLMAIWDDLGKFPTQLVGDLPSSRDALLCPNDWQ